ncbi:probable LRR receptor-like serine/threonine-protein kinase FLS2 [Coccomyxa sp. Obi]|nr:probable LRR receptor-like serine/threonine-protein kinase FLS2 [Coccomyxa sp. Obi]
MTIRRSVAVVFAVAAFILSVLPGRAQNITVFTGDEFISLATPPSVATAPSSSSSDSFDAAAADQSIPILQLGQTVQSRVAQAYADLYRFSGPATADFFVALTPIGTGSDPDLYCIPYPGLFVDYGPPSPTNAAWGSAQSLGADYIYISTNDSAYQNAINASGVAEFVCAVYGDADPASLYSLTVNTDASDAQLDMTEQAALKSIYQKCCTNVTALGTGTCRYWEAVNEEAGQTPYTDFCNYGLSICNSAGHLIRLDFTQFGLFCDFPLQEMQAFPYLTEISFQSNAITGDITSIGSALTYLAANLTTLDLSDNYISGSLTNSDSPFCQLTIGALQFLNIQINSITGELPTCLFQTGSSLKALLANQNGLTGTIPDISAGSQLESLAFSNNDFEGSIPATLSNAQYLTTLAAQNNRLSGAIPNTLGSLNALVSVRFSNNSLTGALPEGLAGLAGLSELDVSLNNLSQLPDVWWSSSPGLSSSVLTYAALNGNQFTGPFPAAFSTAPNLTIFYMDDNNFSGPLPSPSSNQPFFPSLRIFNASHNHFTGPLPQAFGQINFFQPVDAANLLGVSVRYFGLADNQLTGTLPAYLSASTLPEVSQFSIELQGNNFSCPVPQDMAYLNVTCQANPPAASSQPSGVESASSVPDPSTYQTGNATVENASSQQSTQGSSGSGLSSGAKAGIAVGVIVGVVLIALLLAFGLSRRTKKVHGWRKEALDENFAYPDEQGRTIEMQNGRPYFQ